MGESNAEMARGRPRAAHQLDDTDKRIIAELQVDGRMPFSTLASLVGLSDAATRQRVNRLIERQVISIVAATDPLALGFGFQAMLGITVDGDPADLTSAIEAFDEVSYIVITAGRFDLLAELVCVDAEHLLRLTTAIKSQPGVKGVEIMTYLRLVKQQYAWGVR